MEENNKIVKNAYVESKEARLGNGTNNCELKTILLAENSSFWEKS